MAVAGTVAESPTNPIAIPRSRATRDLYSLSGALTESVNGTGALRHPRAIPAGAKASDTVGANHRLGSGHGSEGGHRFERGQRTVTPTNGRRDACRHHWAGPRLSAPPRTRTRPPPRSRPRWPSPTSPFRINQTPSQRSNPIENVHRLASLTSINGPHPKQQLKV